MDEIAIVLACDDRYAQHAAVAAASMLLCHTDSRPLHFYLFDDGITGVKKEMVAVSYTHLTLPTIYSV